jgi:pyruvate dehydrogenase E1 component alpha subunit
VGAAQALELSSHQIDQAHALKIYRLMVRMRVFEERVHVLNANGELEGFIHLMTGQEAVDASVGCLLRDDDAVFSSFRNHGQCIAKGMDLESMMAELFGREGGCCRGNGGSMHFADHSKRMFGGNGIVGSSPPLALGPALAARTLGTDDVSVAFFGEGAAQQGTTHEALNLAAVWDLPVIFVCANNMYAQATPITYASRVPDIAARASAYGMAGLTVDGQDAVAIYEAASTAIDRARRGKGPTLVEAKTFLYYGAWEGEHPDSKVYRSKQLEDEFRRRDPIELHREVLLGRDWASEPELQSIHEAATDEIDRAVEFARASRWPDPADLVSAVYVEFEE